MSSDSKAGRVDRDLEPSGFFVFRTPLLPLDEFLAWSEGLQAAPAAEDAQALEQALAADRGLLRMRLSAIVERPVIRDALFVASPDLDESLDVWIREPESDRGKRIERAIVRYFSRLAGRATPFGLFAGTSVGRIGDRTRLVLGERETYRRRSRLDMDYLFALAQALGNQPSLRKGLEYRPNSSLYRAAGRHHYVEVRLDGKNRTHHLVAVEDSKELRATLDRAAGGARFEELVAGLAGRNASRNEAEEYVGELIDSQILSPDLTLFVTGPDPTEALAARLRAHTETVAAGERLDSIRKEVGAIDAAGLGADPARYRAVARQCGELPSPVEMSHLFQVDMVKPAPEAVLGGAVLDEIIRGVGILGRLARPRRSEDLARFRDAFVERYEGREISLVEALDEEIGIGFPPTGGGAADDRAPLLKDLAFPEQLEETSPWSAWERFLLDKLADATARGSAEITLEEREVERLESKDSLPLPGAFAVTATLAAANEEAVARGDFRVLWNGCDGPSGARLLGRFCDADPELLGFVKRHLRAEEALEPRAVFAEIVHLPEGRLGNILFRPVLRDFEIPYLGTSGAPEERQIPITDLFVSVSGREIHLRSAHLDRRVIPRLTSAHNFHFLGLPLYRFLCELQTQGSARYLGWDWGPMATAPFLPRVTCGRLVFSPARWTISGDEIKPLGRSRGADRFRAVQSWRAKRRLPRIVLLSEGDNLLPVDLDNLLSVESFVQLVKDRGEARLAEMFPGPDELYARGPEGRFVHELIVPFVRTSSAVTEPPVALATKRETSAAADSHRRFPPGSEWLYAKLYAGAASIDSVLRETVAPLVRRALRSGAADRWFFVRYDDPQHHLRLRFHGGPARLLAKLVPDLQKAAAPLLDEGRIWRLQLDTYEREIKRYGGPEAMEIAERVFQVDSEAVMAILERLEPGDAGADERWRLTLRSIDFLLQDCGIGPDESRSLIDRLRKEFAKEMRVDDSLKRSLGSRFRKESQSLQRLLDPNLESSSSLAPGIAVFRRRSRDLAPAIRKLRALEKAGRLSQPISSIAASYIHMHVNRMLRSAARRHEVVLYDFLARLYESRAMRARPKP
ncbi:MAG TPA: lantibiotic dehydratase [Thermoanaerobaculia bacterium]